MNESTELEELRTRFSDFHKDLLGFRPVWCMHLNSIEYVQTEIQKLHNTMNRLLETGEGREALRNDGWVVNEADYDNLQVS